MQPETKLPAVHVTNYQQYINAEILTQGIADHMPADAKLPENLYVSVAYMQVQRFATIYKTVLVLSLKGKSHRYQLAHGDVDKYLAQVGLDQNKYSTVAGKDNHICQFNAAFEAVVHANIRNIAKDVIKYQ